MPVIELSPVSHLSIGWSNKLKSLKICIENIFYTFKRKDWTGKLENNMYIIQIILKMCLLFPNTFRICQFETQKTTKTVKMHPRILIVSVRNMFVATL